MSNRDLPSSRLPADRPPAVPAQPAAALHDKHRAALGALRRSRQPRAAVTRDEDLAIAAAVPVHGDSLATQLVRELVRTFDVGRGGVSTEIDRLADRGVN